VVEMYLLFSNHAKELRRPLGIKSPSLSRPYTKENFVYCDLKYQKTVQIKQNRLGSLLENYKKHYEKPVVDIFETIWATRRKLGNKRARGLVNKPIKYKKMKSKKSRERMVSFMKGVKNIDEKYHDDILKLQTNDEEWSKEDIKYKEDHFKLRVPNLPRMPWAYIAEQPPRVVELTKGIMGKYEWERKLDDPNLVERILLDLKEYKFPFNELDWFNRQSKVLEKSDHKNTVIDKMLKYGNQLANVPISIPERPAVAIPVMKKKKIRRPKIQKVSDKYPLAFEANTYPQNDRNSNDPYHNRKAVLYVNVPALKLTRPVKKRLIGIARYRNLYDESKQLLVLTSTCKRTYKENRHHIVSLLQRLLTEAWKADLNYLPPPDKLEPHEQVDREIATRENKEKEAWLGSFESICGVDHWTIFRFKVVPDPGELSQRWLEGKKNLENVMRELKEMES